MATQETTFAIPKMDCASEEQIVRMALQGEPDARDLRFDLGTRTLVVRHEGPAEPLLARLEPLGFGARIVRTAESSGAPVETSATEGRVLKQLLAINGAMFLLELVIGIVARSTGVLADSVDMFADAAVYGVSLYGVGKAVEHQRSTARASGLIQLVLAAGVLFEVARRAVSGSEPLGAVMAVTGLVALIANLACMALLARHRTGGVHMKASWIFSTNDVLANLGVLLAGVLVWATGSAVPDLVIGGLVGLLVLSGAARILRLSRAG